MALVSLFLAGFIFAFAAGRYVADNSQRALNQFSQSALLTYKENLLFLFRNGDLVDANPAAQNLLQTFDDPSAVYSSLVDCLQFEFPDLEARFQDLSDNSDVVIQSVNLPHMSVEISRSGDRLLCSIWHDPFVLDETCKEIFLRKKVSDLERALSNSPYIFWKEDQKGQLSWCNRQYIEASNYFRKDSTGTPTALHSSRLFPDVPTGFLDGESVKTSRCSLISARRDAEHWFNVVSVAAPDGAFHFSSDATAEVKAEASQRDTVRTFVQIFAQLAVGLVIFDQSRRLVIYNPAFCETMGLDPVFLASKPTLPSVLDRLRNSKKAPEPTSYSVFRGKVSELEKIAKEGLYEEVWQLPDRQEIKVTGKPYPDGAMAFFFEDVSEATQSAIWHRSQKQSYQDALNLIDDPIQIFSPTKQLLFSNDAAKKSLGLPRDQLQDLRIVLLQWKNLFLPNSHWGKIESLENSLALENSAKQVMLAKDGRTAQLDVHISRDRFLTLKISYQSERANLLPRVVKRKKVYS